MHINIKQLRDGTIDVLPFQFTEDISQIEETTKLPINVSGQIFCRAGVLFLSMEIEGDRELVCDRCAKDFSRVSKVTYESVIVESIDNEDVEDDIIVCESDEFDIGELAVSTFILGLDSKNLCSEDCKGLCQKCGANLNEQACNCKNEEIDPRLEGLLQLLDD